MLTFLVISVKSDKGDIAFIGWNPAAELAFIAKMLSSKNCASFIKCMTD